MAKISNRNRDTVGNIYADQSESRIAYHYPASDMEVEHTLALDPSLPDGETRSEWVWLRLANGDLCLATFPQDEGYIALEGTFR